MLTIAILFFIISFFYASVGFGGGSSYIAILAAFGVAYIHIPKISLLCNILVVTGGCYHYWKQNLLDKKLILPFVLSSIPFAYLGGSFRISQKLFYILLATSLIFVGLRILFIKVKDAHEVKQPSQKISFFIGAFLGFLSGMVGIGGGIFLSPLIIYKGWATSKSAAGLASVFILLNSIAGLMGQFSKELDFSIYSDYLPLMFSVIIGGQLGSRLGTHPRISVKLIQRATGVLTLIISFRIIFQLGVFH